MKHQVFLRNWLFLWDFAEKTKIKKITLDQVHAKEDEYTRDAEDEGES